MWRILFVMFAGFTALGAGLPERSAWAQNKSGNVSSTAGFAPRYVQPATAGKRVALVIGNGQYITLPPLANTRNDARSVADALKNYGFQTTLQLDLGLAATRRSLEEFRQTSAGAELAIVFYSGSGIAVDQVNYLVPIDHSGHGTGSSAVLGELIPATDIVKALELVAGSKLIVLDSCRDNPFQKAPASPSKARAVNSVSGQLQSRSNQVKMDIAGTGLNLMIAYSTRYGDLALDGPPGGNSPYTENLLKVLAEPGLDARLVFERVRDAVYAATSGQQNPLTEGSLGDKLVFINPKLQAAPSPQPATAATLPADGSKSLKLEEASKAFAMIKDSTSPAMLDAFVQAFPDTIYGEFARVRAEEIRKTATVAPALSPRGSGPKRKALVIGIKTYDNLPSNRQLTKAVNDARAVSLALKDVGFEVDKAAEDIDRRTFNLRWQDFVQSVQAGDEVVFYFSGHGIEVGGVNYLIPRDVPTFRDGQDQLLKAESINFHDLQQQLAQRGPKMALFIIDACRDNPFDETGTKSLGSSKGLRPVPETRGMFVMFAAGYQQTALDRLNDQDTDPHSVYTRKLIPLMKTKNMKLQDLAVQVREEVEDLALTARHTQVPAYYDQVRGKFCLAGCG